jgi:hypothetical protein
MKNEIFTCFSTIRLMVITTSHSTAVMMWIDEAGGPILQIFDYRYWRMATS